MDARAQIDVADVLGEIRTRTLVVHARDDQVVPIGEGRLLASGIRGAELVELDSKNHILLEDEPAWKRLCATFLEFTGLGGAPADQTCRSSASLHGEAHGLTRLAGAVEGPGHARASDVGGGADSASPH